MIDDTKEKSGLYIHVPFCLSKCGYCSFYSVASLHLIPEYFKALMQEMTFYSDEFRTFDTVYMGGGTPSLLSTLQVSEILKAIHQSFDVDREAEITVEVNPADASMNYLEFLQACGINRLNIGIQSFDDRILKFLGRRHTRQDVLSSVKAARKAGFDNIGVDLIYGVYGQDMQTWQQTLNQALVYLPEHLSCYQLSLDDKTPLYRHYRQKGFFLPEEKDALDFFMQTDRILTAAGYVHYEVSNYARSDALKSRHNSKYWRHIPYLGLGPAAHSFFNSRRWWNKSDVAAYIQTIDANRKPVEDTEGLTTDQLALESLFLGLRTNGGINLRRYRDRFGIDLLENKKQTVDELFRNKLVELKDGCLFPTLAGMAVADSLALI